MGKINVRVKPEQVLVGDVLSMRMPGAPVETWVKVAKIETLEDGVIVAMTKKGKYTTFKPGDVAKVRRDGSYLPDHFYRDNQAKSFKSE